MRTKSRKLSLSTTTFPDSFGFGEAGDRNTFGQAAFCDDQNPTTLTENFVLTDAAYRAAQAALHAYFAQSPEPNAAATTMPDERPSEERLRSAPDREIRNVITDVYDDAERDDQKPPNGVEIGSLVQARLSLRGFRTSKQHIQELAGAEVFRKRRRSPGKTVTSERAAAK